MVTVGVATGCSAAALSSPRDGVQKYVKLPDPPVALDPVPLGTPPRVMLSPAQIVASSLATAVAAS